MLRLRPQLRRVADLGVLVCVCACVQVVHVANSSTPLLVHGCAVVNSAQEHASTRCIQHKCIHIPLFVVISRAPVRCAVLLPRCDVSTTSTTTAMMKPMKWPLLLQMNHFDFTAARRVFHRFEMAISFNPRQSIELGWVSVVVANELVFYAHVLYAFQRSFKTVPSTPNAVDNLDASSTQNWEPGRNCTLHIVICECIIPADDDRAFAATGYGDDYAMWHPKLS